VGFSAGGAYYTSLAFSKSGQPYVAYSDGAYSSKASVMKFDGTNWVYIGNAGFSAGSIGYMSLAFNPTNGQPYVAYQDAADSSKAIVMEFDGTNWVNIGTAGFSAKGVTYTSLAFSPSGSPYVAYSDAGDSDKATVMYYGASAGIRELQSSQISIYPNPATNKITVEQSGETQESYLAILNIEGQQLITHQITHIKTQIDISNLTGGVYFVRVTNDRTVEVGKFMKN
jgi:hypothetical protein